MSVPQAGKIFLGASPSAPQYLNLPYTNRHGLVTGATGTGKTVSLQVMAEGLSAAGVPVFCADIKGDVAGLHFPLHILQRDVAALILAVGKDHQRFAPDLPAEHIDGAKDDIVCRRGRP